MAFYWDFANRTANSSKQGLWGPWACSGYWKTTGSQVCKVESQILDCGKSTKAGLLFETPLRRQPTSFPSRQHFQNISNWHRVTDSFYFSNFLHLLKLSYCYSFVDTSYFWLCFYLPHEGGGHVCSKFSFKLFHLLLSACYEISTMLGAKRNSKNRQSDLDEEKNLYANSEI